MRRRSFLRLSALAPLALAVGEVRVDAAPRTRPGTEPAPDGRPRRFTLGQQGFWLDGQAFQIRSGQMDPIRIPREHWRQRIRMAKALGLNTIASYVMWNALEPTPGRWDWTGRRDWVAFAELCAEEGLWVYLRPGPYVCGEWDFGGLPAWLLRDPAVVVRDGHNRPYMAAVARYFDALAPRLGKLMVDRGGPVLMVQLENEYASYGRDLGYLEALKEMWEARGIAGPFSISDGLSELQGARTYVPGAALGLDGGADFAAAQAIAGDAPVWVGEGYTGWLSHWGDSAFQRDTFSPKLRRLMAEGRSFNLYEVHGGTSFGWGAGANADSDGSHFQADITSYDYGAPITEQGVATDDFHAFRATIGAALGRALPAIPAAAPVAPFAAVTPTAWAAVWDALPAARRVVRPQSNEVLFGQNQGLVLYRTDVRHAAGAALTLEGVHDYATVFADGVQVGTVSRVQGAGLPMNRALALPASAHGAMRLEILVDSFGHVGYGHYIRDEKGLVGAVHVGDRELTDWEVFGLPLDATYVQGLRWSTTALTRSGAFFRATVVRKAAVDSYVDLSAWDKGYVWVNGHLLGRYWRVGPQQRLYCPAGWWRAGANEVIVFDQRRLRPAPLWGARTLR